MAYINKPFYIFSPVKAKTLKATELKLVVSNLVGISKTEVRCSLLGRKNSNAHLSFVFIFLLFLWLFLTFSFQIFFFFFWLLEVGREDLCADYKTSNDLVNQEMKVTKQKIKIYNKSMV